MIICHEHEFIFIRIGKTASTSIEIGLSRYCGDRDVMTPISDDDDAARRVLGYRGPQNYQRSAGSYSLGEWLRLLAKGRRPRDYRHAPAARIRKIAGEDAWNRYFKFCFERNPFDRAVSLYYWKIRNRNPRPEINAFILAQPRHRLSNWGKYTIDDKIAVDFIGRYETLEQDLAEIARRIGVPVIEPAAAKGHYRADRQHYSRVLNAAARTHIETLCAKEMHAFGYSWNDDNSHAS